MVATSATSHHGGVTIHHDKLAYGKLAKTSEEMTEDELLKMLAELNGDEENQEKPENTETDKK